MPLLGAFPLGLGTLPLAAATTNIVTNSRAVAKWPLPLLLMLLFLPLAPLLLLPIRFSEASLLCSSHDALS